MGVLSGASGWDLTVAPKLGAPFVGPIDAPDARLFFPYIPPKRSRDPDFRDFRVEPQPQPPLTLNVG